MRGSYLILHFFLYFALDRGVTDSMNSLLTQALASPPGEKECEAAGRSITVSCGGCIQFFAGEWHDFAMYNYIQACASSNGLAALFICVSKSHY